MKCFGVVPRLFACIRHVDFRGCCATFTYAHASTTSKPISSIIIFCTTSCFPCHCYRRSRCSNTLTPSLLSIFDFSMDSWGVFQKFSVSCGARLFLRGSFADVNKFDILKNGHVRGLLLDLPGQVPIGVSSDALETLWNVDVCKMFTNPVKNSFPEVNVRNGDVYDLVTSILSSFFLRDNLCHVDLRYWHLDNSGQRSAPEEQTSPPRRLFQTSRHCHVTNLVDDALRDAPLKYILNHFSSPNSTVRSRGPP